MWIVCCTLSTVWGTFNVHNVLAVSIFRWFVNIILTHLFSGHRWDRTWDHLNIKLVQWKLDHWIGPQLVVTNNSIYVTHRLLPVPWRRESCCSDVYWLFQFPSEPVLLFVDDFCFIPLYFDDPYSKSILLIWTWNISPISVLHVWWFGFEAVFLSLLNIFLCIRMGYLIVWFLYIIVWFGLCKYAM